MSGNVISNLADATAADHALNRGVADARYVAAADAALFLRTTGGTMTGPLQLNFNAAQPQDAVNKAYADALRSPTVVQDVTQSVDAPANGNWVTLGVVRIIINRAGPSLLAIAVACNVTGVNNVGGADVRIGGALGLGIVPVRRVFVYGAGATACGFAAVLYLPITTGGTIDVRLKCDRSASARRRSSPSSAAARRKTCARRSSSPT